MVELEFGRVKVLVVPVVIPDSWNTAFFVLSTLSNNSKRLSAKLAPEVTREARVSHAEPS